MAQNTDQSFDKTQKMSHCNESNFEDIFQIGELAEIVKILYPKNSWKSPIFDTQIQIPF